MISFLTDEQVKIYRSLHKRMRVQKQADRIKAILMLNNGYNYEQIAEILLIDDGTVRRWHQLFAEKGIDVLLKDNYTGSKGKMTNEEKLELATHLETKIYLTAKEIGFYVKEKYGVEYTLKGITSLLHQIGFSYKKPKHIPGKANKEAQEEFIKQYEALKVNKAAEDRIYFMDGVHPLHNSQPAYGWIKKGTEQPLKTNTGRARVNINGAYDIEHHKAVIRDDESINAQSTIALLGQISEEQPYGMIYLISDNATYYKSKLVKEFLEVKENQRIHFIYLPPYSPNLNIIERLWKFFKKKTTYNKYYEKFAVFKENCLNFFKNIEQYKPELESLMTDNFHLIQA